MDIHQYFQGNPNMNQSLEQAQSWLKHKSKDNCSHSLCHFFPACDMMILSTNLSDMFHQFIPCQNKWPISKSGFVNLYSPSY